MNTLFSIKHWIVPIAIAAVVACVSAETAEARLLLKDICRVKGQEENVLHGLGLVVGLNGTGDSGDSLPTLRALARSMELMGNAVSQVDSPGRGGLLELKNAKNVALVWVTAVVPPTGARRGDKLNCHVSAISAKSLKGGRLAFAALQGPSIHDSQIYGLAEGLIHLDDEEHATEARIHQGCRLEEDFFNAYHKDGKITLVFDKNHADFQIVSDVTERLNSQVKRGSRSGTPDERMARALDASNIQIAIPTAYKDDPVQFIAEILSLPILEPETEARVVINERAQRIVISGEVEIGSVVVNHKNMVIETKEDESRFEGLDFSESNETKLQTLVEALNSLKVPTSDVIEIIKGLERNGSLHARLIIE